jgi:hypothetical protein
MAGPIRNFLQRRPLRNAVRGLLGLQPKYGSSRMASMSYTDEAQNADVDAQPTRRTPAPVDTTAYQSRTAAKPVAPSPEARAVSMARAEDSKRRQTTQRQADGITPAQPAPPRPPETGGFALSMDIGETDTPPPNPMMTQSEAYRRAAQREYAQADELLKNPVLRNPNNPNYPFLLGQVTESKNRAMLLDQQADVLVAQVRGELQAQQFADQRMQRDRELALIQHPKDNITEDAKAFADTVRQFGMFAGAQVATDAYFAALNSPAGPGTKDYDARLAINQINAAGIVVADRIAQRQSFSQSGDPVVREIAAIVSAYAPNDPGLRARTVNAIVSAAQQRARLDPAWAKRFTGVLTNTVEAEIQAMKKR